MTHLFAPPITEPRSARRPSLLRTLRHLLTSLSIGIVAVPATAAPLDGLSYVPADLDNSVLVIDNARNEIIKKIPNVGQHPIQLKALPDRSKIYVDNFGLAKWEISVIDTATNTIVKRIPTYGAPYATTALSSDGHFLYFSTSLSVVQVIDTRLDRIVKTIPVSFLPQGIEISPDDQTLYVFFPSSVRAYNAKTGAQVKPALPVGLVPAWSNRSPDGSKLYGLNFVGGTVAVIDVKAWRVVKRLNMGPLAYPISGTVSPDGKKLWVANINAYNLTVIDIETDTIDRVIPVQNLTAYVGFSPDGKLAYLSDLGPRTANLNFLARSLFFDIFYLLPPNTPGSITTIDTATGLRVRPPIVTPGGPLVGVYF